MATSVEHRIWHVPEMLEAILFELPAKDLLLSRAVCKTFKACIENSSKLKKALFLVPDGEVQDRLKGKVAPHRLYVAIITLLLKELTNAGPGRSVFKLNPLFNHHFKDLSEGDVYCNHNGRVGLRGSKSGSDAIWKKMLLAQPPFKKHSIRFVYLKDRYRDAEYHAHYRFENSNGLTMGDVMQAFDKALTMNRDGGAPFEIRLDNVFYPYGGVY